MKLNIVDKLIFCEIQIKTNATKTKLMKHAVEVYEIYYDDNEFDAKFRALNDNKNAVLSIKCKVVPMGRKTRLVLMKFEVLKK